MSSRTPLVKPSEYFASSDDVFTAGYGVFACNTIVRLLGAWVVFWYLRLQIVGPTDPFVGSFGALFGGRLIVAGLIMIGGWLLVAALLHVRFDGPDTGDYQDALGVAGWSYAPNLVVAPLQFGLVLSEVQPLLADRAELEVVRRELTQLGALQTEPVGLGLLLVSTGWSVYILAQGVTEIYDASTYDSWLAASLIGAGSVLLAFV